MGFMKSLLSGFFFILVSSIVLAKVRGPESGLYVFAINMMFILWWGILILWSRHSEGDQWIKLIMLISALLALTTMGTIALFHHDFERVAGIILGFLVFYLLFTAPLYRARRIKERRGEQLTYPPNELKYFWPFQWIIIGVLAVKSNEPLRIFLYLLPGAIGGYLIINGLVQIKREALNVSEGS